MLHRTNHLSPYLRMGMSVQHLLAVFAGTIFPPMILGLSIPAALLLSGLSTLLFHYFTNGKIPFYLSSSFTILTGMGFIYQTALSMGIPDDIAKSYTCFGTLVIGIIYIAASQLLRLLPRERITHFFPPALAGSFIMVLGTDMLFSSTYSFSHDWLTGSVTIGTIVLCQLFGKRGLRLMSILLGVGAGILTSCLTGTLHLDKMLDTEWLAAPFDNRIMAFRILEAYDPKMMLTTLLTAIPLAFIAMGENVADLLTISRTTRVNYLRTMGLARMVYANGLTNLVASIFGAPQNTAYTQTTGLIQLNRICDPHLLRTTALMMILLAFCPKLTALIYCLPTAVTGGITATMYGMVIVVGWRTLRSVLTEHKEPKSLIILACVFGIYLGVKIGCGGIIDLGHIALSGTTLGFLVGVLINLLFIKDYEKTA